MHSSKINVVDENIHVATASVQKWQQQQCDGREGNATTADPVPILIEQILAPRVSVFTILVDELGQQYSLDNGVALQSLVTYWLQLVQRPPGKRARTGHTDSPLLVLKRERQARAVWWEARLVRIWTWPREVLGDLIALCRLLIDTVSGTDAGLSVCPVDQQHTVQKMEDVCAACTRTFLDRVAILGTDWEPVRDALTLDYKCISIGVRKTTPPHNGV